MFSASIDNRLLSEGRWSLARKRIEAFGYGGKGLGEETKVKEFRY